MAWAARCGGRARPASAGGAADDQRPQLDQRGPGDRGRDPGPTRPPGARHHAARVAWRRGAGSWAVNGCHEPWARQLEADARLGVAETLETVGGVLADEGGARRGLPLLAAATTAREALGFPWRPMEADRIAGWIAAGRQHLSPQAPPAWGRGAGPSLREGPPTARRGAGPPRPPTLRPPNPPPPR